MTKLDILIFFFEGASCQAFKSLPRDIVNMFQRIRHFQGSKEYNDAKELA